MLVYRVENRYGEGPYVNDNSYNCRCYDNVDHPEPYNDGIPIHNGISSKRKYNSNDYKFAFEDTDQLIKWFNDEINKLIEYGFSCTVYKVHGKRVIKGMKQLAFVYGSAEKVEEIELDDLI